MISGDQVCRSLRLAEALIFSRDRAKALLLAGTLAALLTYQAAEAARFIDMSGNWAEKSVNILSDRGIIPADQDGKFKPNETVTRAVFASWLVKVLGFENDPVPAKPSFKDVKPTDPYYKAVEILTQKRYLAAYPDGFRPNQFITKAEVVLIVSRALPGPPPNDSVISEELAKFKDGNKIPEWARAGIAKAAQDKVLVNHPNANEIVASALATRAATAAVLYELQEFFYRQSIAEKVSEAEQAQANSSRFAGGGAQSTQGGDGTGGGGAQSAQGGDGTAGGGAQSAQGGDGTGGGGGQSTQGGDGTGGGGAQSAQGGKYGGGPDQAFSAGGSYGSPGSQFPSEPTAYAGQPPAYPNQGGGYAGAPPAYQSQPPAYSADAPLYQGQVAKSGAPGSYLQGGATVVEAGTHFRATLNTTLSSAHHQVGQEFTATVCEPLLSGGSEVVPVGSKLIGQITNVVPAKSFRFSANGTIDVKFTAVELPDGRRFPLQATIDAKELKEAAGVRGNAVTNTASKTGKGAVKGMKWGGVAGGVMGAVRGGGSPRAILRGAGQGAMVGTVLGAGAGLVGAGVQKGTDVRVPAGLSLPIRLDEALQMQGGLSSRPVQQLVGGQQFGQPPGGGPMYGAPGSYPMQGGGMQQPFGNYPMQPTVQPFGYPAQRQY